VLELHLEGLASSAKSIIVAKLVLMSLEQSQNMLDSDEEKMNVNLQSLVDMDRPRNVIDRDGRHPAPSFGLMETPEMRFDSFQLPTNGSSPEPSRGVSPAKKTGSVAR